MGALAQVLRVRALQRLPFTFGWVAKRPVPPDVAEDDRLFPLELAHRLAGLLPHATVATIEDSWTFVPEDQPELLARLVVAFARTHATT